MQLFKLITNQEGELRAPEIALMLQKNQGLKLAKGFKRMILRILLVKRYHFIIHKMFNNFNLLK